MRVREAKDFLVAQTAEQAALQGVPLSGLEKRMMYFTEGAGASEDPIKLNEEFEAEYDSDEYEAKISRLLHHAYRRLRKENDAAHKNWDLAIKCLRRGDHYLLVMWDLAPSGERPPGDSLRLFASAPGVIALGLLVVFIASKFEPQWRWLQEHSTAKSSCFARSLSCAPCRRSLLSAAIGNRLGLAPGPKALPLFSRTEGRRKGF